MMPENRTRMPAFRTLHDAAANGTPAEVEALLAAGADPDAPGDNGVTPLHLAVGTLESATGRSPDGFADPGVGGRCWTWPRTPNRAGRRSIRAPGRRNRFVSWIPASGCCWRPARRRTHEAETVGLRFIVWSAISTIPFPMPGVPSQLFSMAARVRR